MSKAFAISFPSRWVRCGALCLVLGAAVSVSAVDRILRIEAPMAVKAGADARARIVASSNAGQGEIIGFLHAEASVDDGVTWTALCYLDKGSSSESRQVKLPAAPAGGKILLRARVAFRGGPAGDVDFKGGPILWEETWGKWTEPPARHLTVTVRK